MIGRVVSTKLKNTVTVLVERSAKHPLYKKTYVQSKRYLVSDLIGVKLGDVVEIVNCKPISKRKAWNITKVLGKNFAEIAEEHMKEKAQEAIAEVMPEEKTEELSVVSPQVEKEADEKKKKPKKERKSLKSES